jgi:hypothetical protein
MKDRAASIGGEPLRSGATTCWTRSGACPRNARTCVGGAHSGVRPRVASWRRRYRLPIRVASTCLRENSAAARPFRYPPDVEHHQRDQSSRIHPVSQHHCRRLQQDRLRAPNTSRLSRGAWSREADPRVSAPQSGLRRAARLRTTFALAAGILPCAAGVADRAVPGATLRAARSAGLPPAPRYPRQACTA